MEDIAIIAAVVLAYALVSRRLARTVLTGPMLFFAFGAIAGPDGLDIVDLRFDNDVLDSLARATLVLVLFNDASLIDWPVFWRNRAIPARLLGVGLPLCIGLGAVIAKLMVPGIEFWQAALVAVLLAPTDAALGQAVVTNTKVPITVRESLSVESGLNDGIASPLVPLFIAGALIEGPTESSSFWVTALEEIGLGLAVGVIGGLVGAVLIGRASRLRLMTRTFQQISVAVLPILFLGVSESIDGNAFIAAFVGGIVFGNVARHVPGHFFEFSEQASQVLLLVTFMLFGAMFAADAFDGLDWQVIVYAFLSLVLIRPVTAAFSLIGTGFNWRTLVFMGWFGPRGLASIVFILIVLAEEGLPGSHAMFLVVAWTVAFSIFAHGLTAQPAATLYGRRADSLPEGAKAPEMAGGDTFFLSTARLTGPLGARYRNEEAELAD